MESDSLARHNFGVDMIDLRKIKKRLDEYAVAAHDEFHHFTRPFTPEEKKTYARLIRLSVAEGAD